MNAIWELLKNSIFSGNSNPNPNSNPDAKPQADAAKDKAEYVGEARISAFGPDEVHNTPGCF